MSRAKLSSICVGMALAVAAMLAPSAQALVEPLFLFSATHPGFESKGTMSGSTFENTAGSAVDCSEVLDTGKLKSKAERNRIETLNISFTHCEEPATHVECTSSPLGFATIEAKELEGELGFLLPSGAVGLLLTPKSGKVLTEFECGSSGKKSKLEGSVVCHVAGSLNTRFSPPSTWEISCQQSKGEQRPLEIEIEEPPEGSDKKTVAKDTLKGSLNGGAAAAVGLGMLHDIVLQEEELEIKG